MALILMLFTLAGIAPCYGETVSHDRPTILNFGKEFKNFWSLARDKPLSEQVALWDKYVEGPHQSFFDEAIWEKRIRPAWAQTKDHALAARLGQYPKYSKAIIHAFNVFPGQVKKQADRLRRVLKEFKMQFPIYAVVAPSFDAKSVLIGPDTKSVALAMALDSITIEHANYDVLLPHEFFHAFHAISRGYVNDGVMPNVSIVIPLWEEGLATYVSGIVNPRRSNSDLLLSSDFERLEDSDLKRIAKAFLSQKDAKVLNPSISAEFKAWFSAGGAKIRPDLPDRCGYYLGLQVARRLRKTHGLSEMVAWNMSEATQNVVVALKEMSR